MWRRQRKLYHARLNVKTTDTYLPYQVRLPIGLLTRERGCWFDYRAQYFESIQFLHDVLFQPDEILEHTRRFTASVSTTLVYGWRTPKIHDACVKRLLEVCLSFKSVVACLSLATVVRHNLRRNQLSAC